jgi:hypothetical protein
LIHFYFFLCSLGDHDDGPPHVLPLFKPERPPGAYLPDTNTREARRQYMTPLNIFQLFFTETIIQQLCQFTNENAAAVGPSKPSMFKNWKNLESDEFNRFIGLLMYMGLVQAPNVTFYWCNKSLCNGLWARSFMQHFRFLQIMCFLKVSDRKTEKAGDKLCKVRFLFDIIRRKCMKLYQPDMNISIDERMVKNKGRYSFRQYIRDKPTKWGMKLWVLADARSGYTYNFDVYLGKANTPSKMGLAYEVVINLVTMLLDQGYRLFVDNFYSGVQLFLALLKRGMLACGTVICNRKGFPAELKNIKKWEKKSKRGDMRWVRLKEILALQWRDNKTVSVLSTMHKAKSVHLAKRRTKVNGAFVTLDVSQPDAIKDYNANMSGVDKSDQLLNKYNMLRKTNKYWKTLFFHFVDIARVNSYILFQDWRRQNPDYTELHRKVNYSQLDFTQELIRQLGKIGEYEEVPVRSKCSKMFTTHAIVPGMVKYSERKNCKLCYSAYKKKRKTRSMCMTCETFLCLKVDRNCLLDFHKI